MAERYGARIEDYDLLVPAQYWGSTVPTRFGEGPPEVDFLHFQYPGHVLVADRVTEILQTDAFGSRE
jgi:hypothetical protein